MNLAKLRRSRDVPEHEPVKIEKRFPFRNLIMFKHGFFIAIERGELVPEGSDLSKRSRLSHWGGYQNNAHISSGRRSPRLEIGGRL
jgi:hypothetical protein